MRKVLGAFILGLILLAVIAAIVQPPYQRTITPIIPASPAKSPTPAEAKKQATIDIALKQAYAKDLEDRFLGQGIDAHVRLTGKDKTTLVISYVLMSRPFAYKLMQDRHLIRQFQDAGFKRVHFASTDQWWDYDL